MKNLALILLVSVMSSACSKVIIHSMDGQLTKTEKGIQFYDPEPYLLVTYPLEDGKVVTKTEIIYLPNLANPKFVELKSGFGSSNLSLSLTNGMLTSVGQQVDTKIPETITSVSGLAGLIPGLGAAAAAAGDGRDGTPSPPTPRLFRFTNEGLLKEVPIPFEEN